LATRSSTCAAQRGNGLGTTIKYLRCATSGAAGIGLGTTIKYLRRAKSGAANNCLSTTIKYLRSAASNGQGTSIKYLRRTTRSAAGNALCATINYLRRTTRHQPGHYGLCLRRTTSGDAANGLGTTAKYSATHNEQRRGQQPGPMPGFTHVPINHNRPAFALFVRASFANKKKCAAVVRGLVAGVYVGLELACYVHRGRDRAHGEPFGVLKVKLLASARKIGLIHPKTLEHAVMNQ
jgi:hypothetical protein